MRNACEELVTLLSREALGRSNALTARELRASGYEDRELRVLIHEATERGELICADNTGYFIPATKGEVAECVRRLRSQGQEMLARAAKIERLAEHHFAGRLF